MVPPVPIKPIPAVGEPSEHVLVDCVGPLPKTKNVSQCASTCFHEAIPLQRIVWTS